MRNFLRTIFKPNLCLLGIVLGIAALIFSPIMAHAATLPAPKAPPPKLYIIPKLKQYNPKTDIVITTRPQVDTKWVA